MAKATTGAQVLGSEPAIEELIAEWKRSMKEGKDPFIIIPNGWDTPGEGRRKAGNKKILEAKQKRAKADAEKDVFKRKQLVEEADKLAAEGRGMGGSISREIDLELAQNIVANERILDARTAWLAADKRGDEVGKRRAEQEARDARKAGGTIPNCDLDEMKRMIGNQMILSSKIMWAEAHKDQDAAKKEQAEKLAAKGRAMGGTITTDDDLEDAQQMVANEMIWGAKQIWDDAQKTGGDASGAVASAKYAREKMGATITIDHSTEEAGRVVADNRSHAVSKYSNSKGRAWNGMYNKADWENQAEQLYEQAGKPGGDKWAQDQLLLAEKILYGPPKEAESAKQKFDEAMKQKLEEAEKPNVVSGNGETTVALDSPAREGGNPSYSEIIDYITIKSKEMGLPTDIALAIAWTESKMTQFTKDGQCYKGENKVDGKVVSTDWGIMQLNDKAWGDTYDFDKIKKDWKYNIDCGLKVALNRYKKALELGEENIPRATYSGYNTWSNLSRYRKEKDERDTRFWEYYNAKPWKNKVTFSSQLPNGKTNGGETPVQSTTEDLAAKQRMELVNFSKKFVGKIPYCLDSKISTISNLDPDNPPKYMDCSDFTSSLYKTLFNCDIGLNTSKQQFVGTEVSLDSILPGDLILFDWPNSKGKRNGQPDHVGMYIGNNEFIHETGSNQDPTKLDDPKQNVKIHNLNTNWGHPYGIIKENILTIRRVIPPKGLKN
ncbi:C40 family peptidase [Paenibacillus elgii]|uniref:C40 family peptidase n=1 Tax=Paenibacillus elgii TaxID=189691 RepID=UPI00203B550C|nr:NlpC/P60 family protein [Paenibacillus elgii]